MRIDSIKSYGQFARHGKFDCEIVFRVKTNSTLKKKFVERRSYLDNIQVRFSINISFIQFGPKTTSSF